MQSLIKLVKIYPMTLLLSCAAIAPPSGGPADKTGPTLKNVTPSNHSNLSYNEPIILEFNELLNPISIKNAIFISNEIKYKIKMKPRKIIIKPSVQWPKNNLIKIQISRKLMDYQNNTMNKGINMIFSTGKEIPTGIIKGTIINENFSTIAEVGLYKWPITDSLNYIQKVEVDQQGNFEFEGIENGKYTIGALEGLIDNFNINLTKNKYSILTSDFITVSETQNINYTELLICNPIERKKITSIDMLSQHSFNLMMNNNTQTYYEIDSTFVAGDSIIINIQEYNRLEKYNLPEFSFILPQINDTLKPNIEEYQFNDEVFNIKFSEPVNLNDSSIIAIDDTTDYPLQFTKISNSEIIIDSLNQNVESIKIIGQLITDWNNNTFQDSIKIIELNRNNQNTFEKIIGGNIIGQVTYNGFELIKIEAKNINDTKSYFTEVNNNQFKFINIPSGYYTLWGFEILNQLNSEVYFSGLWNPYQRAAKFAFVKDTIEVRARWDLEGIKVNFE